ERRTWLSVLEIIGYEERLPFREVDRHGAAHLREHLGGDLPAPLAARPLLHALHHHAPHERRYARHAFARRVRPDERRNEFVAVRDGARRLEQGRVARRLVQARRIGGEHVPLERKRPRAATAAQRAVFTDTTLAPEHALAQLPEQRRRAPQLGEALGAQVTRDLRQVGARREFPVRCDAAVLRAARATGLIIQNRGLGIGLVP